MLPGNDDIAQGKRCLQSLFRSMLAVDNGLAVFLASQQQPG